MQDIDSKYSLSQTPVNAKNYLLLFLIWPFLACITAIANYRNKNAKAVVYLFLIYYGLTFVIANEWIDASRYAITLRQNAALPFSDIFKIIGGIYATETSVDIVEPLISFLISRFSTDHKVLFGAYSALFAVFYLKSMDLVLDQTKSPLRLNSLIHLFFFASILPVTSINGFRMWTAAWIFFYGAYHVIALHNPKYFVLSLSACFVHFSFLSANAILIVYYFAGNRNFIYFPLVLISFIVPRLLGPFLQSLFGVLGHGALKARVDMYTAQDVILMRQENYDQLAWFMRLGSDLVLYYLLVAITIIKITKRGSITSTSEKNLYSFLLLFLAFVNFSMTIPSFGGRFLLVFFLFAVFYLLLYFTKNDSDRISPITLIGLFPMILYTAITFRQGSETMNAWIFSPLFGIPWCAPGLTVFDILFR